MFLDKYAAQKQCKEFIKNCTKNDTMRMASEVLPSNCDTECDICYETPDIPEHRLDIYKLKGTQVGDTAFFLIHGGAFVYGFKELDKNFGMNLAVFSEVPVVNVNYHLLPKQSMSGILRDLCTAVDFISKNRGIRKLHLIGDSACGVYDGDPTKFPGCFFKKPVGTEGGDIDIPDYIYDLRDAIKLAGLPRTCLITGDRDFLHDSNIRMRDFLKEQGIPVQFYDAISSETRKAEHVYAISDPAWQESHTALMLIIKNAVG